MLSEHEKYVRKAMKLIPNLKPNDWDEKHPDQKWPPRVPVEVSSVVETAEKYLKMGCSLGNFPMQDLFVLVAVAEHIERLNRRFKVLEDLVPKAQAKEVAKKEEAKKPEEETPRKTDDPKKPAKQVKE